MQPIIIDGKKTACLIYQRLQRKLQEHSYARVPKLDAILVGDDPASHTYVSAKVKSCQRIGFDSEVHHFPNSVSLAELLAKIYALNASSSVDGFIIQLPLPSHIPAEKVIAAIDPTKDVDGFHPYNFGSMSLGMSEGVRPATPLGVLKLIEYYGLETSGKEVVILGRSNIVGKPLSILLSQKPFNATVSLLHSQTKNIKDKTRSADIIITAMGQPHSVSADMVKSGSVVIDVGISRIEDKSKKNGYRLVGDVCFEEILGKVLAITPVPGGVGPMTIAMLISNTFESFQKSFK